MAHHGGRGRGRVGRPWRRVRAAVILRDQGICWLCGLPGATTADHITPLSKGGAPLDPGNLRAAHHSCNSRRGNRMTLPKPKTSRQW
ncbi:MAG TPA: HNH endonuclease [Mycobacteriales bacterium]